MFVSWIMLNASKNILTNKQTKEKSPHNSTPKMYTEKKKKKKTKEITETVLIFTFPAIYSKSLEYFKGPSSLNVKGL